MNAFKTKYSYIDKSFTQRWSVNSSPLDKMAAILLDGIFKCIFLNEDVRILIKISLKVVPKGLIDNN